MPMIYQPPEAVDGTTAMNVAINDEVQKQNNDLIQAAREQAILQDPSLNYVARQFRQGLLADKMAWQRAYEAGDPQGMATAALNADSHRKQAAAAGVDVSGYGSNVSLIDAAQRFANTDTKALNDIFYNLKDTGRGYTQDVADYLDQGYSIDSAKRLAGQNAEYNTQDNMNRLVDAFHMYGKDPRGAINDNGLRILGQMAQAGGASPSELANFYAQMQASPKDSWNFENSLLTAQNAQNYALDRMDRSQQYTRENQDRAFAQQEKMARLNNDLGIQRMMAQAQIQIQSGVMSKEAGYNWIVQKLEEAGVDKQTARQYAATQLLGGKGSGNGTNSAIGYNSKLVGDLQKERDAIIAQIDAAQLNGDEATVKALQPRLAAIQARIDSAFGMGGNDGGNVYSEIANDYNKFKEFYQKALDDAVNDPNITYADIIAHAERVNKEFADNFFNDSYRNAKRPGAEKSETSTSEPAKPQADKPTFNVNNPSFGTASGNYQSNGAGRRASDAFAAWLNEAVHGRGAKPSKAYEERLR